MSDFILSFYVEDISSRYPNSYLRSVDTFKYTGSLMLLHHKEPDVWGQMRWDEITYPFLNFNGVTVEG